MKKLFKIAALLIIIFFSYTFLAVRYFSKDSDKNPINNKIRPVLIQSGVLRDIYGLHFDGDGKHDYLGQKTTKILLEVDQIATANVDYRLVSKLADQIATATGKEVGYIMSDGDLKPMAEYSSKSLRELEKTHRNYHSKNSEAVLYVLLLDREKAGSSVIGSTLREDGIVIYTQALKVFVQGKEESYDTYFLSTGLHEFGHQLGLPHNQNPGCLMNADAEADHSPKDSWQAVTDFCEYEKKLIRTAIQ